MVQMVYLYFTNLQIVYRVYNSALHKWSYLGKIFVKNILTE
jgi:hypothetical protein